MLVYDWMWWGQLTNQNLVWRCVKVCRGMQRCVEVCGGVHRGAQRCTEGCTEVSELQNFKCPSLFVLGYHWLPLATID